MRDITKEILQNKVLIATLFSWAVAQGLKVLLGVIKYRKFNFRWILETGGMPSAHTASVVALAVCIGKELGFSSGVFALSSIFALITMFDAQTWRRSIGSQARILNKIMIDIHSKKKIEDTKLRELVGHTPIEVFVGAIIGIVVPILFYRLNYCFY